MFEYAKLASALSDMKYMGMCDRLQVLRWEARQSNISNETPHGRQGIITLPPFLRVAAEKYDALWRTVYLAFRLQNPTPHLSYNLSGKSVGGKNPWNKGSLIFVQHKIRPSDRNQLWPILTIFIVYQQISEWAVQRNHQGNNYLNQVLNCILIAPKAISEKYTYTIRSLQKTKMFISYNYLLHQSIKNIPAAIQNSPIIVSGLFMGDLVRFVIIITSLLFNDVCSIGCKIWNFKHFRANS